MVCIYNGTHYSAIKKNEILPFATTWMDPEGIILSEISQEEIPHDFTHMWNLRNKRAKEKREREKPRNRLLTIENKQIATRGAVCEGMSEIGDGD